MPSIVVEVHIQLALYVTVGMVLLSGISLGNIIQQLHQVWRQLQKFQ